nr:pectate lyase [uncultured bacterium]
MNTALHRVIRLPLLLALCLPALQAQATQTEPVAENMLLLQTASGGWSKHHQGKAVDYGHTFTDAERAALRAPDRRDDATIDNKATTLEIVALLEAHQRTGNAAYLAAAQRGVDYLLAAQYPNGGWPQYYPDRSLYRHQVTFNDDAMTRVLELLQDIVEGKGALAQLTPTHGERARAALDRGIACVLATQVRIDGELTLWAAQYDEATLQPAKARSYELPSLAVAESVGVMRLLMRQPQPSPQVLTAVEAGARWLEAHRMRDLARRKIDAPGEETGQDVVIVAEPGASLWARFYDLQHQQPMFVNREGEQVARFADMPNERRVGYAWYGVWPEKLLQQELPRWYNTHAEALRAITPAHAEPRPPKRP